MLRRLGSRHTPKRAPRADSTAATFTFLDIGADRAASWRRCSGSTHGRAENRGAPVGARICVASVMGRLRERRESMGLGALDVAERARCPVEVVLRAELGAAVPIGLHLQEALARAYGLGRREYVDLALEAAEEFVRDTTR